MSSGRESGVYSPPWMFSAAGLTQPSPPSTLDQAQLVLVLLVVGEAEVAEPAGLALDALDEHVVVLGGLVVLTGDALLTVDLLGEEVERAGVCARPEQLELVSAASDRSRSGC